MSRKLALGPTHLEVAALLAVGDGLLVGLAEAVLRGGRVVAGHPWLLRPLLDARRGIIVERVPIDRLKDAAPRVERVVLLGADAGTYASEAEVRVFSQTDGLSERTFAVDVERAPTSERGGEAVALAARKPDVAVADDWSVRFFLR